MNEPIDDEPDDLTAQAYDWLVRVHSGDMNAAESGRLKAWCARSAAHQSAWDDATKLWEGLGAGHTGDIPGAQALPGENPRPAARSRARPPRRLSGPILALATAAVLLLLVLPIQRWLADYSSTVGEVRTLTLEDGSSVQLDTASAIRVHFTPRARDVQLLEGEAAFQVAKDASRPFTVSTDHGSARAVGTEFVVRERDDGLDVTVLEGQVRVDVAHPPRQTLLQAGQYAAYRSGHALHVESIAAAATSPWRQGYLAFSATPLSDVLVQLNRYRRGKILLLNPGLANYRVSGVFPIAKLDRAMLALSETTPARITQLTPYLVLVR